MERAGAENTEREIEQDVRDQIATIHREVAGRKKVSNRTDGSRARVKLKRIQRSVNNKRDDPGGNGRVFRLNPATAGIVGVN